jgi:tetratricopeptide (TPR) repeat protein
MTDISDAIPQRIGPHHRTRRLLARGGMGAVYEVIDERDARPLALKLMHDEGARLQALFEREYRTLRGLAHPRIVQAHEYGFDGTRPFYTMELVEGSDLHALAPLDYRKACGYLRDVASALALLHTRGLLHRDLSARNVRATADGHCKLLDFGAVASFGVQTQVVGTPPCIAPETLRRAALDQRTDLFALGALAYWLLTGRHAFAARTLGELPECWALRPPRPSELAPHSAIPPELDALVAQLLSLDPTSRPHSTTEISERLSVIAHLPPEAAATRIAIARSYFETPEFVGRAPEQSLLLDALHSARSGIGSCWLLRGESGAGRSRLLSELVTQARLRGVTTLGVDASAHPQARGTAIALLHAALDASPHAKQVAAAHAELRAADDLDKLGLALYAMIAAQLRALHHAFRGERKLFQHHREQVEQHAVQAGSAWQVEQWEPAALLLVQLMTFDLVDAKRAADRLSSYERTIPSLARHAQLARLILRTSRLEELPRVVVDIEALLTESGPRGFVGWGAATGLLGRCLNRLGRHAEARDCTASALALVSHADRELVALFLGLEIEHALSLSGLGEHARAAQELDNLLQRHSRGDNPLTLGRLHEARALVAQAMQQSAQLIHHAHAAQRYFGETEIEVLIARGQSLVAPTLQLSSTPPANDQLPVTVTTVVQSEHNAVAIIERLQQATHAPSCALFHLTAPVTQLLAFSGERPAEQLIAEVTRTLEAAERMNDDESSTTVMDEATDIEGSSAIYLLRDHAAILGAVAIDLRGPSCSPPSPRLLRELAELMHPLRAARSARG